MSVMVYNPPLQKWSPILIQKGYSSMILAWYSALQAGLLILLVRTAVKGTLTSCS